MGAEREACRGVPRTLHRLHPLSIARTFPTRRAVGGVGAVLPAFVFSVLYGPASRQLPPAAPPLCGNRASVAKPLPLRTNPYEPL